MTTFRAFLAAGLLAGSVTVAGASTVPPTPSVIALTGESLSVISLDIDMPILVMPTPVTDEDDIAETLIAFDPGTTVGPGPTVAGPIAPVPLPASSGLILLALGALALRKRLK